jgi:hypothetical protein
MCATCFGLYLGHTQEGQYKNLTKKCNQKFEGPFLTVTFNYNVKTQNIAYKIKSVRPK